MSKKRTTAPGKASRAAARRYISQRMHEQRQLVERYETQPVSPAPEPEGVYRP